MFHNGSIPENMVKFMSSAIHIQNLLFHTNVVLTEKGDSEVAKWKNPYCDWVSKLRFNDARAHLIL
jgi:hypothetical protein